MVKQYTKRGMGDPAFLVMFYGGMLFGVGIGVVIGATWL